jgi:L-ribulokinase
MIVASAGEIGDRQVAGICGQVDGSIIPGMVGLEAGQSAFGDVYAWFVDLLSWPAAIFAPKSDRDQLKDSILGRLSTEAEKVRIEETGMLALDWLNGRRTPDADQSLRGAIIGLTLGTTAPKLFRTLVEATAFGSRAITDRFEREGVSIESVIALGGISQKSPFVMQVTADVMNRPIQIARSEQTCALGAAMFGAVAAGIYGNVEDAQKKMESGYSQTYTPIAENAAQYDTLYRGYVRLGEILTPLLRDM